MSSYVVKLHFCVLKHTHTHTQALHWEPDDPTESSKDITYGELHREVCRVANALKDLGVGKGDTVSICMPMTPEVVYTMLACTRIGAVHSVIFGGFTGPAVASRIEDCQCKVVVTADEGRRAGKSVKLKENVDEALSLSEFDTSSVSNVLVLRRTGNENISKNFVQGRDVWMHEMLENVSDECEPEIMDAEDPLFILYTSGSTGKPKGVQHSTAGYLLVRFPLALSLSILYTRSHTHTHTHTQQATMTHRHVFDYRDGDVYWCTADAGWITGHSYIVYGPLSNGATSVLYEGVPNYPDPSRIWQVVDKYNVTQLYTSPTAIRALMAEGDDWVKEKSSRDSLRLLGTVGEPINPEAWRWFDEVVGESRCPIVDTWWQTETGAIMATPLPGATVTKPGSCCVPYFGVEMELVDSESGKVLEGNSVEGNLCIANSWPSQLRTLYGNHDRFLETYFSSFEGKYFTGDRAKRDEDGYLWITGRADDVLNVSGHRLGTSEIESALVLHESVAEAAVVGFPHDVKGEGIYVYVSLMSGEEWSDNLRADLVKQVRDIV
jgi:acetyl-CoA synthetase